jgi:tetraacyldisaccharide-1-P 4'-kinase
MALSQELFREATKVIHRTKVRPLRKSLQNHCQAEQGDEPCYMAQQLAHQKTPVMVHSNRVNAAKALLIKHPEVNVIISDDGLQHYKLKRWPAREGGRDIELVIRDDRGKVING